MPHLRRAVHDRHIQSRYIVPEVIGDAGDAKLAEHIKMACSKKGLNVAVDEVSLASIAFHDRENILSENGLLRYKLLMAGDLLIENRCSHRRRPGFHNEV